MNYDESITRIILATFIGGIGIACVGAMISMVNALG